MPVPNRIDRHGKLYCGDKSPAAGPPYDPTETNPTTAYRSRVNAELRCALHKIRAHLSVRKLLNLE